MPSRQGSGPAMCGQVPAATASISKSHRYALAFGVLLITGGRLGDVYGRRRFFLLGAAGFTLAPATCGLAPSAPATPRVPTFPPSALPSSTRSASSSSPQH